MKDITVPTIGVIIQEFSKRPGNSTPNVGEVMNRWFCIFSHLIISYCIRMSTFFDFLCAVFDVCGTVSGAPQDRVLYSELLIEQQGKIMANS